MNGCPERELALLAYHDGELDDDTVAELEAHLAACPGCRTELERVAALSAALRRGFSASAGAEGAQDQASSEDVVAAAAATAAPETLRAAVRAALRTAPATRVPLPVAEPRRRPRAVPPWRGWRGAAAAATVVLATLGGYAIGSERARSLAADAAAEELLSSHLRALLPGRLTDVLSSDRHQVKPWFAGRLDFAPPVPELTAAGYHLVGGRVDFFAGERAAAIVYMRRRHVIDVYILPVQPDFRAPASARAGYSLVTWREGALQLVAISDVDRADLERLAHLHAEAARPRIAPVAGK